MSNATELPNEQAVCLSFDETEAQNILFQDTLFEDGQPKSTSILDDQRQKLMYLEEKCVRLKWHGVALSEYWRKKQIPRGLRVSKRPTLGHHDPDFMKNWEKILNKCSLDLTLLIIEQTKRDVEKTKNDISELKTTLKDIDAPQLSNLEMEIQTELKTFEEDLKAYKIRKFERDAEDYRTGSVYNWKRKDKPRVPKPAAHPRRYGRPPERRPNRDLLLTSESETSDQGHTSASSTDDHFLGGRGRGRGQRGKRRGGGNGSRDPNRVTRSLHRNIR